MSRVTWSVALESVYQIRSWVGGCSEPILWATNRAYKVELVPGLYQEWDCELATCEFWENWCGLW